MTSHGSNRRTHKHKKDLKLEISDVVHLFSNWVENLWIKITYLGEQKHPQIQQEFELGYSAHYDS